MSHIKVDCQRGNVNGLFQCRCKSGVSLHSFQRSPCYITLSADASVCSTKFVQRSLFNEHAKRLFFLHLISHRNVRNEAIEPVLRRRHDHVRNLRMEVQLLNLVLALRVTRPSLPHRVHEEQLRRNIRYLVRGIRLKGQIPNRQLLVARHGENGRIVRRPLHRSDRRAQVVEVAHTAPTAR